MPCVPLTSARPSFASSAIGASPATASAAPAGSLPSSERSSPCPISGSARFASGARSPDAPSEPCSGTDGDQLAVQHLDHAVDDQRPHAGVPERQDVRPEQEHRSGLLAGQRASDGGRVRAHDAQLERGGLGRIDPHVGQGAEPGRDPVDRVAGRDDPLDHRAGRLHPCPRLVAGTRPRRRAPRPRRPRASALPPPRPARRQGYPQHRAARAASVRRTRRPDRDRRPRGPRRRPRRPGTRPSDAVDATTSRELRRRRSAPPLGRRTRSPAGTRRRPARGTADGGRARPRSADRSSPPAGRARPAAPPAVRTNRWCSPRTSSSRRRSPRPARRPTPTPRAGCRRAPWTRQTASRLAVLPPPTKIRSCDSTNVPEVAVIAVEQVEVRRLEAVGGNAGEEPHHGHGDRARRRRQQAHLGPRRDPPDPPRSGTPDRPDILPAAHGDDVPVGHGSRMGIRTPRSAATSSARS